MSPRLRATVMAVVIEAVDEGVELEVVVTILSSAHSVAAGTTKAGVAGDESGCIV